MVQQKTTQGIEENEKRNVVKAILNNWHIVLFIGSIIVAWTNLSLSNSSNAQSIIELSQNQKNHEEANIVVNSQIQIQLSQIQTDLSWIKLKLK